MSPNHTRHVSEGPTRSARLGRDTPATSSSAGQFTHCSQISIHDHYRERYRTGENPEAVTTGNIVITYGKVLRPEHRGARNPLDQGFRSSQIVCYDNKQNVLAIVNPEGSIRNIFPFDTGTTCRQWRGRGRCGPHCGVSRGE